MPIRVSRILLLVEGVVLVLPIGALFLTLIPGALFFFTSLSAFAASALTATIGVALLATLGVMGTFWSHGAEGLHSVPRSWWWLCAAGAAIALIGGVSWMFRKSIHLPGGDFFVVLRLAAYGVPLLIPFAHVLIEYFFRTRSRQATGANGHA